MNMKRYYALIFILAAMFTAVPDAEAQTRNASLTIEVTASSGESLQGQPIVLEQTDYAVGYGALALDADGCCTLKVYPGNHRLTVERAGYDKVMKDFTVASGDQNASVSVTLEESTRAPFALKAVVNHDAVTGNDDVALSWNVEDPAFFDDFESYDPFAVTFGNWTGIDADGEATAALQGTYPNRGVMQYAQIINPLTVVPTWWYDYPILRPYEGKQYVGFIRTASGRANDDWLISPELEVGTDNVLEFMAKAADRYTERFMVYVTTQILNPSADDFVRIDQGNFESVDYRGWQRFSYDLSAYAGKKVKFAIRYVSDANRNGAFMLMLDNVYVGQPSAMASAAARKALRARHRSPANPNESFDIYIDGVKAGHTEGYYYTLTGVASGHHTVGVQAVYRHTVSEISTIDVEVGAGPFAKVDFNVEALSKCEADRVEISLLNLVTGEALSLTTSDGKATLQSLPQGSYAVHVDEGVYEAYDCEITVDGDRTVDIILADNVIDPYNLTVDVDADSGNATVRWNQELGFADSFEDYDDFATGSFGEWQTLDLDQAPVYPIGLGSTSNIVSFPGSGTASNPTAIAPMVFNPLMTVPAMSPADKAIEASDGVKSIIFFSPQRVTADKWLISPVITVHEDYVLRFKAKAYTPQYPESIEVLISTEGSAEPADFTLLASVDKLVATSWGEYSVELGEYTGNDVRIAIRYTSTDAFLAQVDDFNIGKPDGAGDFIDYGNVVSYEIWLDGVKVGESATPQFVIENVAAGQHTVGIRAMYLHGASAMVEYTFGSTGIDNIIPGAASDASTELFDLMGRKLNDACAPGIYIVRRGADTFKIKK